MGCGGWTAKKILFNLFMPPLQKNRIIVNIMLPSAFTDHIQVNLLSTAANIQKSGNVLNGHHSQRSSACDFMSGFTPMMLALTCVKTRI